MLRKINRNIVVLAVFALVGIIALRLSANWGSLWHGDSSQYVQVARQFSMGNGLVIERSPGNFELATGKPPLYFVILGVLGGDAPQIAGWWLNAVIFGANIFLIGWLIFLFTNGSLLFAAIGAFFALSSPSLLHIHATIFSEPLFVFFTLLSLVLFNAYFKTQNTKRLIFASLVVSLAILQRYAGVMLVSTYGLGILLLTQGNIRGKVKNTLIAS